MSLPPRHPDHRSPKRQRGPPVFEYNDDDEEDDEDYSAASVAEEEDDEDSGDTSVSEEHIGEEEEDEGGAEIADDVGATRMATIGNDLGDTVTEAQSQSSPSASSSQQSIKLKSSDILDCPTCCEPLKRPIYQCTNGHIACSLCCTKLRNRCPFCRSQIGDIRCRAMEKVIEASIVPCRNAVYGCKEATSYGDYAKHEKLCVYIPCSCPIPKCNYIGSYTDLKRHARDKHSSDPEDLIPFVFDCRQNFGMNLARRKIAVFQEKDGDLIVVQAFKGSNGGVYMTVSCMSPMSPGLRNLSCSLAKLSAYTTLRLGLMVKKIQKVGAEEEPKDGYMFIPSYMLSGDHQHLMMQICIGRESKYCHI